eukprot:CAMPEP_0197722860 /NCGR_PEP_ID=MMETSP1434-20131217/5396_1 /TAXON_ID=265543 /ORGANISM="Minutocellus polymorphus, Strain CCMP3303" /LENGTH=74 /DNA_ID=CAMNT_0043308053 /DNA_START=71 /DNA_END=295 /DNA_ORIENTATION=-
MSSIVFHTSETSSEDNTATSGIGPPIGPLVLLQVVELLLVDSTPPMLPDESHSLDGIHVGELHKSYRHQDWSSA